MPDDVIPDAPAAPAGDPAPVAPVATDPAPAPSPADDISALPESWQSHIRELRAEAAEKRTSMKPFAEAFEGYSDNDRQVLLEVARTMRDDPKAAGEWMAKQAELLLAEQDDDVEAGTRDPDEPMTRAELESFLAERERQAETKRAEQTQVAAIVEEAKGLGYDPESDRRGYARLLDVSIHETGGDLKAAHEAIKADRQKVIDEFLASKAQGADTAATLPPQTGTAQAEGPAIRTFEEAQRLARAAAGLA